MTHTHIHLNHVHILLNVYFLRTLILLFLYQPYKTNTIQSIYQSHMSVKNEKYKEVDKVDDIPNQQFYPGDHCRYLLTIQSEYL